MIVSFKKDRPEIYLLMYISIASEAMLESQLDEIVVESRAWNKSHDLTGFLAYVEGELRGKSYCRFIQVLEGPKEEVVGIFNTIQKDSRHSDITVVKRGAISNRNFGSWEMGFEKLDLNTHADLRAFFHLDPEAISAEGDVEHNMLLTFMKNFYENTPS